uniref:Putative vacuolar h+-atpase v0 sector accessory subunit s1 ac45 n=1 Tax=Phlebotomus kandelakii TaxID=1109342 RepID=A0A6B2EJP3_9DIPT
MNGLVIKLILICAVGASQASLGGPYILWGLDRLRDMEVSALRGINDKTLKDIYGGATYVIIFLQNSTARPTQELYPRFMDVINNTSWIYLPQNWIFSDSMEYNPNTEVNHLVGPPSQCDSELATLFRNAELTYGEGKVLGILASNVEDNHEMRKREITEATTTPLPNPTDEPMEDGFVYYLKDKAIMYTTIAPVLIINDNTTNDDDVIKYELKSHGKLMVDERDQYIRLMIQFKTEEGSKIFLRFKFPIRSGYWYLTEVEVEDYNRNPPRTTLLVRGEPPYAPMKFSWHCTQGLVFRSNTSTLILDNVQIQPYLNGRNVFYDAYDCVGFMSAPIWSGIAVSFLVLFGVAIAINAILEIKPPNRFESNRNKQLTFTIQE